MKNLKIKTILLLLVMLVGCGQQPEQQGSVTNISSWTNSAGTQNTQADQNSNTNTSSNIDFQISTMSYSFNYDSTISVSLRNKSDIDIDGNNFNVTAYSNINITYNSCTNTLLAPESSCHVQFTIDSNYNSSSFVVFAAYNDGVVDINKNLSLAITYNSNGGSTDGSNDGGGNDPITEYQLHQNDHSYQDCWGTSQNGRTGIVVTHEGDKYCRFNSVHHNTPITTEISDNPFSQIGEDDQDETYCPAGFKLKAVVAYDSKVEEHTNAFGGRAWNYVSGSSDQDGKEICKGRNLLGCNNWVTFYPRLVYVYCY